ncbi:capsular polysaccharide transport system permease protein [Plasticicumulans lactativorans]|uniref:Capsular polysaccharide transport system permease protein n=1 Tax=Plasticicumulans lactativorans TaxID=1133106 RepID=A0A4V6NPI8_9GAMM|nr:capsule biosynthesis protein [Plasticicumulans lactativorans]TCO80320.1 capsular polysaccharide transport system permease protein [Plasticicumulans lactativorans]
MTAPLPPEALSSERRWRRLVRRLRGVGPLGVSAVLCIGLPTLLAVLFYGLLAADRYVAEARIAVRGSQAVVPDLLGALGVPAQGGAAADALVVQDYVRSREAVEALQQGVDLRAIFNRPEADWFTRLAPGEPIEDVVKYWGKRVEVNFDATSGITTLQVAAFRPEDAVRVAQAVVDASESLVNRLSERARKDAVAYAEEEVRYAQGRVSEARTALTHFREQRQSLDPARSAEARLGIIAELEGELAKSQAELAAARAYLKPGTPTVVSMEARINALRQQIKDERARLAGDGGSGGVSSGLVGDYEKLMIEREFAEKLYSTALASLEAARAEAGRKQRYLVAFVQPHLPEQAEQPQRVLGVITVFFTALMAWSIGALAVAAIKDHAGWV